MVEIQSAAAEIREEKNRRKKEEEKNIMSASATQGGLNKRQDENIMVCPIP